MAAGSPKSIPSGMPGLPTTREARSCSRRHSEECEAGAIPSSRATTSTRDTTPAAASSSEAARYNNDLRACSRRLEDAEGVVPQAEPGTAERLFAEVQALEAGGRKLAGKEKEAALFSLHSSCRLGLAQACIRYQALQGTRSFLGAADAVREEGFALARACDLGDGEGCLKLARHHDPTDLFANAKDFPAAIAAYSRACDAHSLANGCEKASALLRSERKPKPDPAPANAYQIKAQKLRGVKLP